MTFNSCLNLTVGRSNVTTTSACSNTIAGGCANDISALATNCHNNFIGAGRENCVIRHTNNSAIVAGYLNHHGGLCVSSCTGTINSIIGAGLSNCTIYGERQGILAGACNRVCYSHDSVIGGGCLNRIGNGCFLGNRNAILAGYNNCVGYCSTNSVIVAGGSNSICPCMGSSAIVAGGQNIICSNSSIIGAGNQNKICGTNSACSAIVTGCNNRICSNSCFTFIGTGLNNVICNSSAPRGSAILGGESNINKHCKTFIIGSNITTTANCYTFMNNSCTLGVTRTFYLVETSAKKYKKCITSLNPQLDNIKKLSPVEFTWKETEREDVGFIAEDVEKVLPKLVSYEDNGELHGVQYSKLTAILVKAIQEQQEQIDKLKEEVELLKQNK